MDLIIILMWKHVLKVSASFQKILIIRDINQVFIYNEMWIIISAEFKSIDGV